MKRHLVPAALLALTVAGCSAQAAPPVATTAPAQPAQTASPSPSPTASKTATWGDTIALPSGLTFTLAPVGPKPATQYTDGGTLSGKTFVFKTTLHNGTTQPLPTTQWVMMRPTLTAGTDGHQVQGNSWDGRVAPAAPTLQPGETATWEWGIDDPTIGVAGLRVEYAVPQYLGGNAVPVVWKGDIR